MAGFGVLRFRLEFVCGGVELAVSFPSFRWVGFEVLGLRRIYCFGGERQKGSSSPTLRASRNPKTPQNTNIYFKFKN